MQMKLIITRKVLHLALFWKWEFLELANGLLAVCPLRIQYRDQMCLGVHTAENIRDQNM